MTVTEFQNKHLCAKSDDFSLRLWRYLTICNMATVRRIEFSKFRVYVMWPLSSCYAASLCKISLKSDNRLLSYGQKRFLKWQASAILNFKKCSYLVIWLSPSSKYAVVYQISPKSHDISWRYDNSAFVSKNVRCRAVAPPLSEKVYSAQYVAFLWLY